MQTYAYGFPRLGPKREYKKAIEQFWQGSIDEIKLTAVLDEIEQSRLTTYHDYVDHFPLGEFTCYDLILDTACMLGVYPCKSLQQYYSYARAQHALPLQKFFNTNYHYLVPTIEKTTKFSLQWNKPLQYWEKYTSMNHNPVHIIGPYTFLSLSRVEADFDEVFSKIAQMYQRLFQQLQKRGVAAIHLDDPALCQDISKSQSRKIIAHYQRIIPQELDVYLTTYYDSVDILPDLYDLPLAAIGLDFISNNDNKRALRRYGFPADKKLLCGIVDGRNPRRTNILSAVKEVEAIRKSAKLSYESIIVTVSCPLSHLPLSVTNEPTLNYRVKKMICFAQERLQELALIKQAAQGETKKAQQWSKNLKPAATYSQRTKPYAMLSWQQQAFARRRKTQQQALSLPALPLTTIGSFPQDKQIRNMRKLFKDGSISVQQYNKFIRNRILKLIEFQEDIGLDVLVHGEFERSDMVEFFAQQLKGFATTQRGWVISYGTRCYRPPIIYSKISRPQPLTLKETFYAQSITPKAIKGIITGPITIFAWSFCVRQEPSYHIVFELANALQKEVKDLVEKGIKIIQVDEPALKEAAPLKKRNQEFYYSWAVRSFNHIVKVPQHVQVHTHLCYSNFSDIQNYLLAMNFDVISIEAARAGYKALQSIKTKQFNRAIGPGLWDVHSPAPLDEQEVCRKLKQIIALFGKENVWINPDCGLKTRTWEQAKAGLRTLSQTTRKLR